MFSDTSARWLTYDGQTTRESATDFNLAPPKGETESSVFAEMNPGRLLKAFAANDVVFGEIVSASIVKGTVRVVGKWILPDDPLEANPGPLRDGVLPEGPDFRVRFDNVENAHLVFVDNNTVIKMAGNYPGLNRAQHKVVTINGRNGAPE